MEKLSKKVIALGSAAIVLAAGLGAGIGYLAQPEPVVIEKNVTVEVPVTTEVVKEVPVEVEVIKVVSDNSTALLQDFIVEQDGDLTMLDVSEIDDNGVAELMKQVNFVYNSKELAIAEVKSELADLVHKEVVAGETLDRRDIERIKVQSDYEDVAMDDIDYEDLDADLTVTATFEQDDVKYEATFIVEVKDGKVEDVSLDSLDLA